MVAALFAMPPRRAKGALCCKAVAARRQRSAATKNLWSINLPQAQDFFLLGTKEKKHAGTTMAPENFVLPRRWLPWSSQQRDTDRSVARSPRGPGDVLVTTGGSRRLSRKPAPRALASRKSSRLGLGMASGGAGPLRWLEKRKAMADERLDGAGAQGAGSRSFDGRRGLGETVPERFRFRSSRRFGVRATPTAHKRSVWESRVHHVRICWSRTAQLLNSGG